MKAVLIIDEFPRSVFEQKNQTLLHFDYQPDISATQVEKIIHNYEGLILRSKMKVNAELLSKANKLEFIGRSGAGLENIDLEYAKEHGIKVFNSPEGNRNAVAEHALGMIFALLNQIPKGNKEVREAKWNRLSNRGTEIADKTLGIIGCGHMGSHMASKCSSLFDQVLCFDKYKQDYAPDGSVECNLEEIFEKADVLSLHTNLTEETRHMVDRSFLGKFMKPIVLVNTSRGQVVNTEDLIQAIEDGHVKGACLDVLEYESLRFESLSEKELPESFRKLTAMEQVILSPHVAGWTHESAVRMPSVLIDKITDFYSKK
jgi:D-3-phosphoglycerate dehydrogenase